ALWGGELADWILKGFKSREFTLSERLLTELRVVVYYLSLLFYTHPDRLNLDYDFSLSTSLLSPLSTLGSLILILSLFCFAIAYSRNRLLSFAILWYFGNLAIESTAIPLEIIYEHRTYLPFMMLFVIFSTFINQILHKWTWRLMVVGVLFFILSIWTSQRATLWGDDIEIWKDAINKSPNKARTHHNLGVVLRDKGWLNNAIPYFKNAIRLDPNYFHAHQNLGSALLKINQPEQALIHFTRSSEINPNYPVSHIGRGQALAKLGRPHEAIIAFEEVIRIEPDHYRVHGDLGAVLIEADRIEEAIKELSTGLKYDPDNASIHYNIGLALAQTNRSKEAIAHMRKAVDIDQKYVLALRNLSILLFNKGEIDEPITLLRKAARLSPEDAGIWSDLGMVLLTAGRKEEAIEFLRKALQLDPGLTSAQQRLQEAEGLL
ncbi:MAG: tetratricopeptide repeat protein, partial [Gammaproteobacteria bacterium]